MIVFLQGVVIPVKRTRKDAYCATAAKLIAAATQQGALRVVECWGDEIADGQLTDFRRAVKATAEEDVVVAWTFWSDEATCKEATQRLQNDPAATPGDDEAFDPHRIIWVDCEIAHDTGGRIPFGYVDAMAAPAPSGRRDAYVEHAGMMASQLQSKGALRVVSGWGVDAPAGETTDFRRAVAAEAGETVTFGWVEWPSKAASEAAWAALATEGVLQGSSQVWDGRRAIFGGFEPILDSDKT